MRIALGCDHAGFVLKGPITAALEADGHDILDLGTFSTDPVDYPDFARAVGQAVLRGFVDAGILVCGSGVGASIAANKIRGIRAAMITDETIARYAREHNGTNVMTLGSTLMPVEQALRCVEVWLGTPMTEARYIRRLVKIRRLEDA
jgi:ribose 5-phosphate isomerase B